MARSQAGRLAVVMTGVAACIGYDLRMIKINRRPVCGYMAVFACVRRCHMARRRGAALAGDQPHGRGMRAVMAGKAASDNARVFELGDGPTQWRVTVAVLADI